MPGLILVCPILPLTLQLKTLFPCKHLTFSCKQESSESEDSNTQQRLFKGYFSSFPSSTKEAVVTQPPGAQFSLQKHPAVCGWQRRNTLRLKPLTPKQVPVIAIIYVRVDVFISLLKILKVPTDLQCLIVCSLLTKLL